MGCYFILYNFFPVVPVPGGMQRDDHLQVLHGMHSVRPETLISDLPSGFVRNGEDGGMGSVALDPTQH